jgi:hypothetical protein
MRVIIACEYSGRVREAFRRLGHDAWSCDLLPAEDNSPYHYQCDIRDVLGLDWDLMIAHPDCTYLCRSGLHWNTRGAAVDGRPRQELTEDALDFVRLLMVAPIPRIAIENPVVVFRRIEKFLAKGYEPCEGFWVEVVAKLKTIENTYDQLHVGQPAGPRAESAGDRQL